MRKRVSIRLLEASTPLVSSRSKCLIHTVPVGNDQLPLGLNVIVWLGFGSENQRLLMALSDQKETLTLYGTMPALGVSDERSLKAPVAARVGGKGVPVAVAV